jgi:hypothetical protein
MDLHRVKRARTYCEAGLTFLPRSWWDYLDWAREARALVHQITGGRVSPGMRVLLNFIDQFIQESFGRREFSLSPEIVDHITVRFREELEAILDAIDRRNSLKGKVPIFGLGASTSQS